MNIQISNTCITKYLLYNNTYILIRLMMSHCKVLSYVLTRYCASTQYFLENSVLLQTLLEKLLNTKFIFILCIYICIINTR